MPECVCEKLTGRKRDVQITEYDVNYDDPNEVWEYFEDVPLNFCPQCGRRLTIMPVPNEEKVIMASVLGFVDIITYNAWGHAVGFLENEEAGQCIQEIRDEIAVLRKELKVDE
jgi:hypothetical protein